MSKLVKIFDVISRPVYFTKFKRVGIEAAFAINVWFLNAAFTNYASFASLPADISLFRIELSEKLSWCQYFEVLTFNFLMIYALLVYMIISFSDPGRIESKMERKYLNERFSRLHKELCLQQLEFQSLDEGVDVDDPHASTEPKVTR